MSVLDRLLLGIYSLSTVALSIVIGLVAVGWTTPLEFLQETMLKQDQRVGLGVVAIIYAIVSLKFLVNTLGTRSELPQAIIRESDMGQVRITVQALENLVKKTASQIRGVRDVRPRIFSKPEGIGVFIHVIVAPDLIVPQVSEEIQVRVKESLEEVAGVKVQSVKVLVENIAADAKVKDKVY